MRAVVRPGSASSNGLRIRVNSAPTCGAKWLFIQEHRQAGLVFADRKATKSPLNLAGVSSSASTTFAVVREIAPPLATASRAMSVRLVRARSDRPSPAQASDRIVVTSFTAEPNELVSMARKASMHSASDTTVGLTDWRRENV